MTSPESLPVILYGTHVGDTHGSAPQELSFEPHPDALARWGMFSPILSAALPLGGAQSPDAAINYFGGMLPEGQGLARLSTAAGVPDTHVFALLRWSGGDLIGAPSLTAGTTPTYRRLTDTDIRERLDSAELYYAGSPLGGGSSLPGYQRKIALALLDGQWFAHEGGAASTHILKPARTTEGLPALLAEQYTLTLARTLGLSPFQAQVVDFAGTPALVIERFDRIVHGGSVERIHQEDAAQALGLPWRGNDKFGWANPAASLVNVAALVDTKSTVFAGSRPNRERLLAYTTFNVAVGNTDAHAKNNSIIHRPDGAATLAPLYDAAPLALDVDNGTQLAMSIAGKWQLPEVTAQDLITEAQQWGIATGTAERIVHNTLDRLVQAVDTELVPPQIAARIPGFIRQQAQNMLDGGPARIKGAIPAYARPEIATPHPLHLGPSSLPTGAEQPRLSNPPTAR